MKLKLLCAWFVVVALAAGAALGVGDLSFAQKRVIASTSAVNSVARLPAGFEPSGCCWASNALLVVSDDGRLVQLREGASNQWAVTWSGRPVPGDMESLCAQGPIAGAVTVGEETPARIHAIGAASAPLDLRPLGFVNVEAHAWIPFGSRWLLAVTDQLRAKLFLVDAGAAWGGTAAGPRIVFTADTESADCADLFYSRGALYGLFDGANRVTAWGLAGYGESATVPGHTQEGLCLLPDGRTCIVEDRGNVILYSK